MKRQTNSPGRRRARLNASERHETSRSETSDDWMTHDYTCGCGIYVHPSRRNPKAIHIPDCPYKEA